MRKSGTGPHGKRRATLVGRTRACRLKAQRSHALPQRRGGFAARLFIYASQSPQKWHSASSSATRRHWNCSSSRPCPPCAAGLHPHLGRRLRHGPEAYTLAMMLRERMSDFIFRNVRIHATDVEPQFGPQIAAGTYAEHEVKRIPQPLQHRYFQPADQPGFVQVVPEIRAKVSFAEHDLLCLTLAARGLQPRRLQERLAPLQRGPAPPGVPHFHRARCVREACWRPSIRRSCPGNWTLCSSRRPAMPRFFGEWTPSRAAQTHRRIAPPFRPDVPRPCSSLCGGYYSSFFTPESNEENKTCLPTTRRSHARRREQPTRRCDQGGQPPGTRNLEAVNPNFRPVLAVMNTMLDAFVAPINVTAEYVDRISKGDIPPKITDTYNGDFNEIKNNLNQCIDALNGLMDEMNRMSREHDAGDIDVAVPTDKFQGAYQAMAEGVNKMVFGHIAVKKKAMACIAEFGKGNFEAELEKFPGKKVFINETIERLRTNIKSFIAEMHRMSDEHNKGDIDVAIPVEKFEGVYKTMAKGSTSMVWRPHRREEEGHGLHRRVRQGQLRGRAGEVPRQEGLHQRHHRSGADEPEGRAR